jgi:hypothetical protein
MPNNILDVSKLIAKYYNTNQLKFDLNFMVDYRLIFCDKINNGEIKKYVIKNKITNEYITYIVNTKKNYKYAELINVAFQYNYLTGEYYVINTYETKSNLQLQYFIFDIQSLQNKKIIAKFLVKPYVSKEKQIVIRLEHIPFTRSNKYAYDLCANKLIRWNIKDLNIYSHTTLTHKLLHKIPLFVKYDKDNNSTIIYNYTANEKSVIPSELIDVRENMYYVKLKSSVYALIDPFKYKLFTQFRKFDKEKKIMTKILI